jgi:antitoxin MazE
MPITVKVSEWGNSLAIRLPRAVVDQLGLKAGSEAELDLEGGSVRLTACAPTNAAYPTLAEMVEEMRRLKAMGVQEPELTDWGPDVGDEKLPDEDWSAEHAAWLAKQK